MELDKQILNLSEWKSLKLNGVEDIAGFEESYVILDTRSGRIAVEGEELKIESLSRDSGEILICGQISGIFKSEREKKKGFLGRITNK